VGKNTKSVAEQVRQVTDNISQKEQYQSYLSRLNKSKEFL
jgi:hypothetical protein